MYYSDCMMVHIKDPLLLNGKSSSCGGSGFPLSLSGPSPYNRKQNVLSAPLKKIPSISPLIYIYTHTHI